MTLAGFEKNKNISQQCATKKQTSIAHTFPTKCLLAFSWHLGLSLPVFVLPFSCFGFGFGLALSQSLSLCFGFSFGFGCNFGFGCCLIPIFTFLAICILVWALRLIFIRVWGWQGQQSSRCSPTIIWSTSVAQTLQQFTHSCTNIHKLMHQKFTTKI